MSRQNFIINCSIFLFLSIMVLGTVFSNSIHNTSDVFSNNHSNIGTIIIDAGHGGEDGGAEAPDGTLEKDINLKIALKLKTMLLQSGFNVKTIRDTDISVCDNLSTVKERKTSDLKNRLNIFNENQNNVVLSIHQNKFEQSKYYGSQIFYSPNHSESSELAENVRTSIVSLLQPDNTRQNKSAGSNIYVLNKATVPAIIVECGFLSNQEELAKLKTDEYQQEIAFAIYTGFVQYYANNR